jgi:hypothetical protein
MKRTDIKHKLREGIDSFIREKVSNPAPQQKEPEKKEEPKKDEMSGKKDYSDVLRAVEKIGGPSMVDVMKLVGIEDDKEGTNRSLFRKKIKQEKNPDTGSYYQFNDEELASVRSALHIQK